jgi:competence ComEA-like helix-hairpin-helix protein
MTPSERRALVWVVLILFAATGVRAWVESGHAHHGHAPPDVSLADSLLAVSEARLTEVQMRSRPLDPNQPLDLNRADEVQLDRLPGVGPALAGRIVAHRADHGPFRSLESLGAVRGIGPATLARIRPYLKVGR